MKTHIKKAILKAYLGHRFKHSSPGVSMLQGLWKNFMIHFRNISSNMAPGEGLRLWLYEDIIKLKYIFNEEPNERQKVFKYG